MLTPSPTHRAPGLGMPALCLWLLAATTASSASCPQDESFQLTTSSGEVHAGELQQISAGEITLQLASSQPLTIATSEVARLQAPTPPPAASDAALQVHLRDASMLRLTELALEEQRCMATILDVPLQFPRGALAAVKFAVPEELEPSVSEQLDAHWQQQLELDLTADRLLLRKQNEEDGTWSLTPYDGVILSIDAETVQFRFDDTVVPVKRNRLHGLLFYQVDDEPSGNVRCRLTTCDASQWMLRTVTADNEQLQVETMAGVRWSVPHDRWYLLDWAFAREVYLDELSPSTEQWEPFVQSLTVGEGLTQLYTPRRNVSFRGEPLRLFDAESAELAPFAEEPNSAAPTITRGLALKSRTRLVYSLQGAYQRLVAQVGIDPAVRPHGHVELIITADGRELLREVVTGEDTQPLAIDLGLAEVQRLMIEVDFGEQADIADFLHLINARLIK